MRLRSVWVSEHKNLSNFSRSFGDNGFLDNFVGKKGSGKSNFLEALIEIFDHVFDFDRDAAGPGLILRSDLKSQSIGRRVESNSEVLGYSEITRQYYDRYRIPVMHTETNIAQGPNGDEAINWRRKEWANVVRVLDAGVPLVGFCWYSITDQIDWDSLLTADAGVANPVELYDLDRTIREVGRAYKELIAAWGGLSPLQSTVLTLPLRGSGAGDADRRYAAIGQ